VESTVRIGFPPGITTSGTRNPPEEYDSAGNSQLMEADSGRQDQNVQKVLKTVTISESARTNPIFCEGQLLKNLNTKTSLKGKINLIRNYQEVHIYSMKSKKDTKIS
jgi:hypothetical protein